MTVEEYRQRMIDAFHNADCDNLIALVALPSEKEFEHLEWLLKNHYHNQKQQPCEDAVSRKAVNDLVDELARAISDERCYMPRGRATGAIMWDIINLPPVTPKEKTGWIPVSERLPENGQSVLFCDIDNDIMIGYHVKGRPDTHFSQDGTYKDIKDVRAWMPLPEPYKVESEGV